MAGLSFIEYYDSVSRPSAPGLARAICQAFRPASVVEVGSVSDVYLEQFLLLGVEARGTRPEALGTPSPLIESGRVLMTDPVTPNPFGFTFDVALSLEVADKLPGEHAAAFVRELSACSDRVVFSAAAPGQGGFHVNAQPLEFWVRHFWDNGFELDIPMTLWMRHQWVEAGIPAWLQANVAVFARSAVPADTIDDAVHQAGRVEGWYAAFEWRLLFHEASRVPRDEAIVEVGTFKGRSAVAMALGAAAGRAGGGEAAATVYTVDHHCGDPGTASHLQVPMSDIRTWSALMTNLRSLRLTATVVPILADGVEAGNTWAGPRVRLLFLDGARGFRDMMCDFDAWRPHLAPGALVVFGGVAESDGPLEALLEIVKQGACARSMTLGKLGFARYAGRPAVGAGKVGTPHRARPTRRDRISIIMPTRNEGPRLRATIDSLLANTHYPDFELIVLDDASADGSTDFLLASPYYQDERITLIRWRHPRGYLPLWIEGVERSSGSVLKFLDAHHCFSPYWLTNLYESLSRRRFQAIVGPVVGGLEAETWTLAEGPGLFGYTFDGDLARIRCLGASDHGHEGRVPWLCGHQMMMSRATYDAVGGFFPLFEGHGTDDSDLCLRAFLLGIDCHVEPTSVIGHYHKNAHINLVTHADVGFNVLMSVYLNFGEARLEAFYRAHEDEMGYREGRERMKKRSAELECFRDWIVRRQSRTPEELLEHLAHY